MTAGLVSEFLVLDEENPGAIVGAVGHARENARSVRELISTELWEAVNTSASSCALATCAPTSRSSPTSCTAS